jgi:hypothetical protein
MIWTRFSGGHGREFTLDKLIGSLNRWDNHSSPGRDAGG